MKPKGKEGTIFDPQVWNYFENWIIESGLKVKFNVVTFYMEKRKVPPSGFWDTIAQAVGLRVQDEENVMHVVTNKPGKMRGSEDMLLRRYRLIFTDKNYVQGIDHVEIHEVKDQEKLLDGVQRKMKNKERSH